MYYNYIQSNKDLKAKLAVSWQNVCDVQDPEFGIDGAASLETSEYEWVRLTRHISSVSLTENPIRFLSVVTCVHVMFQHIRRKLEEVLKKFESLYDKLRNNSVSSSTVSRSSVVCWPVYMSHLSPCSCINSVRMCVLSLCFLFYMYMCVDACTCTCTCRCTCTSRVHTTYLYMLSAHRHKCLLLYNYALRTRVVAAVTQRHTRLTPHHPGNPGL